MSPDRRSHVRAPYQLPRGRHKLSRSEVEANQRARILDAVVDVVSLVGYAATTVEEIIGPAGVSRRTFYDHFKNKEDAFLAALDAVHAQLLERVRWACDDNDEFAASVRDCLRVFLEFFADEPRYADMCIVEVLAAGPSALDRRSALIREFAAMLRAGAESLPGSEPPPPLAAQTVVGGVYEVVHARVLSGLAGDLPTLLPDLAYSIMLPYLGYDTATNEARVGTADAPA